MVRPRAVARHATPPGLPAGAETTRPERDRAQPQAAGIGSPWPGDPSDDSAPTTSRDHRHSIPMTARTPRALHFAATREPSQSESAPERRHEPPEREQKARRV